MAGAKRDGERQTGSPTLLEDLSLDLTRLSAMLACLAEREAVRREAALAAGRRIGADRVKALTAARHARSAAFGLELANPGWSLLLELYRARLEGAAGVRPARLATDARVAMATMRRWIDLFIARGLAERREERGGAGAAFVLTPAGAEAIEDYFAAAAAGDDRPAWG